MFIDFSVTVQGQLTCNSCVERDAATCSNTQTTQICALSSRALGTSHCGSAIGKYRDEFGNAKEGFIRGCIDCAGRCKIKKNNVVLKEFFYILAIQSPTYRKRYKEICKMLFKGAN